MAILSIKQKTENAYTRYRNENGKGPLWRFLPRSTKSQLYIVTFKARRNKKSQVTAIRQRLVSNANK